MTQQDLSEARNPDLRASLAAMRRAAELARQTALQTNTALVVVKDGKLLRISAVQLRRRGKSPADALAAMPADKGEDHGLDPRPPRIPASGRPAYRGR
jgi:hypothetical protein